MSMFKDMLKSDESLFKNDVALDFSFQPKLIKHRENEQRQIAACITPLVQKRNGKNIFVYGKPGIGKTIAVKKLLEALEEEEIEEDIYTIFINCWQKNTSFKIISEICENIGYKFTQNKKTEDLFKIIANILNRKSAVFVFDEVDKVEDIDFIYTILEKIYRKSIILITNHKNYLLGVEERVKSRLATDILEFKPYNEAETKSILQERKEYAFSPGVWENDAFLRVVKKTYELGDIRSGLHLMKEAGLIAESESVKKITLEHVKKALAKLDEVSIKDPEELEDESKFILEIVKKNTGKRIGELFKQYQEEAGKSSYKTFQRKIQKLREGKFINVKKITGGKEGSTTIINYLRTKKLTEY